MAYYPILLVLLLALAYGSVESRRANETASDPESGVSTQVGNNGTSNQQVNGGRNRPFGLFGINRPSVIRRNFGINRIPRPFQNGSNPATSQDQQNPTGTQIRRKRSPYYGGYYYPSYGYYGGYPGYGCYGYYG